jgi:hypothetical protein
MTAAKTAEGEAPRRHPPGAGFPVVGVDLHWDARLARSRQRLTGRHSGRVREIAGLRRVTTLSLADTKVTGAGLAELSAVEKLTTLCLDDARITDRALSNVTKLRFLENLDLRSTYIGDAGLAELGKLKNLKTLNLRYARASNDAIATFQRTHPDIRIVDD